MRRLAASGELSPARPTVILAERQTAGRGNRGHRWISPPGSVYLSVLWRSNATPDQIGFLPLVVALAAREALAPFTTSPISVKWPNDLLTPKGKLVGILVENIGKSQGWIIGLGANVLPSPDSGFLGASYLETTDIEAVAAALINGLFDTLQCWEQGACDFALFEEEYQKHRIQMGSE
jgi:BirA family biotin operon repressor/biotin-[acetyl-CoA-carboxylase] ligase